MVFWESDLRPTNVFTNLDYNGGGTDTAGALERVRTEDIFKTRNETTYVMVFTDGKSSSVSDTIDQAKLLHPLVDEVFALGIGYGIHEDEIEAIASKPSNMGLMEDFQTYDDYISQFILRHHGCKTRQIRPFRAIDLTESSLTVEIEQKSACAQVEFEIDPFGPVILDHESCCIMLHDSCSIHDTGRTISTLVHGSFICVR